MEGGGMGEKRYTEAQWLAIMDLPEHWHACCDCDPFDGADTFHERMEAAGFIRMRPVTKRDLEEESFPEERGINWGGWLWELTRKGHRALVASSVKPQKT